MSVEMRIGSSCTPAEKSSFDAAVAESRERAASLQASPDAVRSCIASAEARKRLRIAEDVARRARETMARFDHDASLARENETAMPPEFWAAFGAAYVSVRLAERDVAKAREIAR